MCLECGARMGLDYRRATGWKPAAVIVGAVLAIAAVALVLGLRAVDDEADKEVAKRPAAATTPRSEPGRDRTTTAPERTSTAPQPASGGPLAAAKRIRIAVLSGSEVPGVAAKTGKRLRGDGFRVGAVGNGPGPSEQSRVLFAGKGDRPAARALAKELGIRRTGHLGSQTAGLAKGAGLVVIVGADRD